MAIQKMKLVNIVGLKDDFERVVSKYLLKFDMHIESAVSMLGNVKGLYAFSEENPYSDALARMQEFFDLVGFSYDARRYRETEVSYDEILSLMDTVGDEVAKTKNALLAVKKRIEKISQILKQLEKLLSLNIDLDDLFQFRYVKFRFGRMPRESYKKLVSYLGNIDAFFVEGEMDKEYVYGIYFMPARSEEKIDGVFSSLYFERIIVSGESHGTPGNAFEALGRERRELLDQETELTARLKEAVVKNERELTDAYEKLLLLNKIEHIRKYSAHTRESFYILAWVPGKSAALMEKSFENEPNIVIVEEDPGMIKKDDPPIKLKNPRLFRPFEMFVEMYGLPDYNEIDPTPILAVTYALMFAIMFGDVGQGLLLMIGGLLLYRFKRMPLAAIVAAVGACSAVSGLFYGSVFGFEEILRENPITGRFALIDPMKDINTILISTVGLGAVIILGAMALNIVNALKNKRWGKAIFDQNGLAGAVFYVSAILTALGKFTNKIRVSGLPLAALMGVSLAAIFLKEPLSSLVEGEGNWLPEKKGEFLLESFFELFEIILSYATNTISFVRLGAFALGHASMMSVVFILADMAPGGVGYAVILVLGNILVIGLEGLVVGIQALRLEFYEMFSRYYTGGGKPFKSIKIHTA